MIFIESASSTPNLWPDVLDFFSSLIASLAWPIAVVFLLLTFRTGVVNVLEAIKDRMPSMERVKTPWLEASWSTDAVKDLSKDVENLGPAGSAPDTDLVNSIPAQLARVKPSAGVIDAFLDVERQIRRYLKVASLKQSRTRSPIHSFLKDTAAPVQLKNAVHELSMLRNAAAHGVGDITLESALEYTNNAARVAREIESLSDTLAELL